MSSPDADSVIVISRGAAYLVNANDPTKADLLPIQPVTDARAIAARQLVVFVSFSSLLAYDSGGMRWENSDFGVDDLKLIREVEDVIEAEGYDPSSSRMIGFAVDLKSGKSHSL